MIYLATPYSHESEAVQEIRFKQVTYVANVLMQCGYHVLSPITHGYPIAKSGDLPHDYEFWKGLCAKQIEACSRMFVLRLEGYEKSRGVFMEEQLNNDLGKPPASYIDFKEFV